MKQHKWYREICAWASGAEIEHRMGENWINCKTPQWGEQTDYRIKPQPKKPRYLYVYNDGGFACITFDKDNTSNYLGKIKLEVDDE